MPSLCRRAASAVSSAGAYTRATKSVTLGVSLSAQVVAHGFEPAGAVSSSDVNGGATSPDRAGASTGRPLTAVLQPASATQASAAATPVRARIVIDLRNQALGGKKGVATLRR